MVDTEGPADIKIVTVCRYPRSRAAGRDENLESEAPSDSITFMYDSKALQLFSSWREVRREIESLLVIFICSADIAVVFVHDGPIIERNLRTMRNKPAVLRRKKVPLQLQQLASASIVASQLFLVLKRTMTGSPPNRLATTLAARGAMKTRWIPASPCCKTITQRETAAVWQQNGIMR